MPEWNALRLTSRDDVVVAVPYLVGFTPTDSLVCLVLDGSCRIRCVARIDLPDPSEIDETAPATPTATLIARNGSAVILVGYGPADRVEPAAALLTTALRAAAVDVREVLRVDGGRYWCLCGNPGCAAGVTVDPAASIIRAEAVFLGFAAPLPDRAALEQLITPVTGAERDRMRAATSTALRRLRDLLADDADPAADDDPSSLEHIVHIGVTAVRQAYEAADRGETLSDDAVGWLTAVLIVPEVRDHAWLACDGSDQQRRLWIDVTRRATPGTGAAPACLLAVTAYLAGDGALANIAADRALTADPGYRLAHLIGRALQAGVPPQLWRAATTAAATD